MATTRATTTTATTWAKGWWFLYGGNNCNATKLLLPQPIVLGCFCWPSSLYREGIGIPGVLGPVSPSISPRCHVYFFRAMQQNNKREAASSNESKTKAPGELDSLYLVESSRCYGVAVAVEVGAGVGVGLLLGLFIGRRRRSSRRHHGAREEKEEEEEQEDERNYGFRQKLDPAAVAGGGGVGALLPMCFCFCLVWARDHVDYNYIRKVAIQIRWNSIRS